MGGKKKEEKKKNKRKREKKEKEKKEKRRKEKGEVEKRKGKRGAPMFPREWKRARNRKEPGLSNLLRALHLPVARSLFRSSSPYSPPEFLLSFLLFVRSFVLFVVYFDRSFARSHFISSAILLRLHHRCLLLAPLFFLFPLSLFLLRSFGSTELAN